MQHVYEVYSNWINMAFVKGLLIHKNCREWKSEKECFKTITFVSHVPGIPYCPCDPFSPCDPLSPRDPFSPFVEKSKVIINVNIYYYSSSLLKISVIIRTDHNFVLNCSGTKTKKIITILKRRMRYLFLTRMESAVLEKLNLTYKPSNIYNGAETGPLKKWVVCCCKDNAWAFLFVLDCENKSFLSSKRSGKLCLL